jgi:membrane associated rhomboid family serine protease
LFFAFFSFFFGNTDLGGKLFGNPLIIGVGASGAIFGLVGLVAVLTPKNKVYLIAGPLIAIIIDATAGNFVSENIAGIISVLTTIYIFISIFFIFSFNPKKRRWALPIEMPFWLLPIVAITPLVIISLFVELPIGNSAHLGGLIAGLAYGLYLKIKYPKKTAFISRVFSV